MTLRQIEEKVYMRRHKESCGYPIEKHAYPYICVFQSEDLSSYVLVLGVPVCVCVYGA